MKTFSVIEYSSFFAIRHNETGEEHPMGDGVDTVFDAVGDAIWAGDPKLIDIWEDMLNQDEEETLACYFPHLVADD